MKVRLLCLSLVGACVSAPHKSLDQRLKQFSLSSLNLQTPTELRWNSYAVPYVISGSEDDAYRVLGAVHAHLRLGQLEFFRRVAKGRLSESAGRFTIELDYALRALDLGKAVDEIDQRLPESSTRVLDSFLEGLNAQVKSMPTPPEFSLMGWRKSTFSRKDLLLIGRLATVDVNWFLYFRLLPMAGTPEAQKLWSLFGQLESESLNFREGGTKVLSDLLGLSGRWASNSWALAPSRTKSRAAILANDPHLGITQPPVWLMAGMHTPTLQITGLMIPGLPVWALGRNPDLSWGGTNMRSLSSVLIRVPKDQKLIERQEPIKVRWWPDQERVVRESPWGPVISDLELLKPRNRTHESLEKVALRWEGHQWSDELTSFLQANRARTVEEFRRAFKDYGVSGQNMLAVDRSGNIGHVLAVRLPDRQVDEPRSYWMSPQELTSSARNAMSLPFNKNPREGILVSSNDRPFEGAPSVGLFFSPKDRHDRIEQQLLGRRDWTTQDLTQLQQDTYSHPSYLLVQRLCQAAILKNLPESEVLCSWSGSFESSSRGALLFQLWLFYFAPMRLKQLYPESIAQVLNQSDYLRARLLLTWSDNPDVRDVAVKQAWKQAMDKAQDVKDWGSLHRLELGHPLANAPLIGSSFRYWEGPVSGGVETVFKTAHDWTDQKHKARYGTNARHLSDMADLDANEFVLMGGNDGWIGSANQADQLPLLLEGKSLRMPLRVETIRREFPIVSTRR